MYVCVCGLLRGGGSIFLLLLYIIIIIIKDPTFSFFHMEVIMHHGLPVHAASVARLLNECSMGGDAYTYIGNICFHGKKRPEDEDLMIFPSKQKREAH